MDQYLQCNPHWEARMLCARVESPSPVALAQAVYVTSASVVQSPVPFRIGTMAGRGSRNSRFRCPWGRLDSGSALSCGGAAEVERLRIEEGSRCRGETVGPIGISLPL